MRKHVKLPIFFKGTEKKIRYDRKKEVNKEMSTSEKKVFEAPEMVTKDTYQSSVSNSTAAASWECKPGGVMGCGMGKSE